MKRIGLLIVALFYINSLFGQLKVVTNDRVGIGETNLFTGTNNNGLNISKGGHSSLLLGDPTNGYGGIIQVADDKHRLFIGANLFDDRTNSWSSFQSGKGAAGFNVIADEGGWGASVSIYASGSENIVQRLTVRANGYVGIGKMPSYKLDVDGYVRAYNVVVPSDARFKTNIADIQTEGRLSDLRPVQYNYTEELFTTDRLDSIPQGDTAGIGRGRTAGEQKILDKTQYGFIAQEVQQLFPQLIEEDSNGMLSVDYISMIPMLVAEMKEQQALIEEMREEINALTKEKAERTATDNTSTVQ